MATFQWLFCLCVCTFLVSERKLLLLLAAQIVVVVVVVGWNAGNGGP